MGCCPHPCFLPCPQLVLAEVRREAQAVRALAASTAAVKDLEGWARSELLALTGKLKTVVGTCAAQQEQTNNQVWKWGRGGVEPRWQEGGVPVACGMQGAEPG